MKKFLNKISDFIFKMKVLFISTLDNYEAWKENVYDKELDELFCCNGRECGCNAITNREQIKWQYQVDLKPVDTIKFKDF